MSKKQVKVVKLLNGEELIAEVETTKTADGIQYVLSNCMQIIPTDREGGIASVQWGTMVEGPIRVDKSLTTYCEPARAGIVKAHLNYFSALVTPDKTIITP